MQKFLYLISLLISTSLSALSGNSWEDATRDEIWLQDLDMYETSKNENKLLPNGFKLLYNESGIANYSSTKHYLSGADYMARGLNLNLVKIQSSDGRMFLGLAEPLQDGNFLPVYGVIDGTEAVLYDYDINFKQLPLPKELTGTWYTPLLRAMFENPDKRWEKSHGGRKNIYAASGWVEDGNPYNFLFMPYDEEDYITFGTKPEYHFSKTWSNNFDRMELSPVTIKKSNGRKKTIPQETGGYWIDALGDKWYSMSYDWNPDDGTLTLKFGPKIRTKSEVDWHKWEGPKDAYNENDFRNVNPGAAYMRKAVPKWTELSPDNVWGELTVKVYAVTDRFMVVSGKSVRAGWNFTEVWSNEENYDGALLSTERRKEIVEYLMKRRPRIRSQKLADQHWIEMKAALEEYQESNIELMRTKWMPYLCDVFNAYRNGWNAYKIERQKYETPNLRYASGWIFADTYEKLTAKYGEEAFNAATRTCNPFIKVIDGELLSTIVESRDVEPYRMVDDEISFLIGTRQGVKMLVYHAEFQSNATKSNTLTGEWMVKDSPTLSEPTELFQILNQKRNAFDSLDAKEQKTLKKNYSKEIKKLQKTPKSVKELQDALKAVETLSEYLK